MADIIEESSETEKKHCEHHFALISRYSLHSKICLLCGMPEEEEEKEE